MLAGVTGAARAAAEERMSDPAATRGLLPTWLNRESETPKNAFLIVGHGSPYAANGLAERLGVSHLLLHLLDNLAVLEVACAQNLRGVNGSVLGTVDGHTGNGHARRHLNHRQQ